jgi:anhydro-N-acetylmuramic acid kinase
MQNYRISTIDESYEVIGVMSGTSADGLDIACCRFTYETANWKFLITEATSIEYNEEWRKKLLEAIYSDTSGILNLDIEFGEFIGSHVNQFINRHRISPILIASHGHTVFHQPDRQVSLQIGNGMKINQLTGIPTINDFRKLDVILGGQGAPLVPIGDSLLFHDYAYCLNLGGFSNISYEKSGIRVAGDICPVNIVLNTLARKMDKPYDDKGKIARNGKVIEELLKKLNGLEFYKLPFPKSLGLEWVNKVIIPQLEKYKNLPDLISTFTHHIAFQINKTIMEANAGNAVNGSVLITGGGAYNDFLIELLNRFNTSSLNYLIPEKRIIDFKEALIFAFIGLLRYKGEINTLKSVTGASSDSCGGTIHDNCSIGSGFSL